MSGRPLDLISGELRWLASRVRPRSFQYSAGPSRQWVADKALLPRSMLPMLQPRQFVESELRVWRGVRNSTRTIALYDREGKMLSLAVLTVYWPIFSSLLSLHRAYLGQGQGGAFGIELASSHSFS